MTELVVRLEYPDHMFSHETINMIALDKALVNNQVSSVILLRRAHVDALHPAKRNAVILSYLTNLITR